MTVIAWDGHRLAADKAQNDCGTVRSVTKIHRLKDGTLLGTSGDSSTGALVERWYAEGQDRATYPDKDGKVHLLVITPDRKVLMFDGGPLPEFLEDPFTAIGCGRGFAIGAMEAGKTATEAVLIACKHDAYCGRGVDVLVLAAAGGEVNYCAACGSA